jgi:hypothetical protein
VLTLKHKQQGFERWCYHSESLGLWTFVHHSVFYILESTTFRKQGLFPSSNEGKEAPSPMGPLERADLSQNRRGAVGTVNAVDRSREGNSTRTDRDLYLPF